MSSLARLGRQMEEMRRRLDADANSPQLGYSSIESGKIDEYAGDTLVQTIGTQHDGTHTTAQFNGAVPPTPAGFFTTDGTESFAVTWDGSFAGNGIVAPMDFLRVDVHAAGSSGFTPTPATRVGEITAALGGQVSIVLPAGTYYVKLVTVSQSGVMSPASDFVEVDSWPVVVTTDGFAPASSPTPEPLPGSDAIYIRFTPIVNADEVIYDLHASVTPSFTHSALTKVGETKGSLVTMKGMPGAAPVNPGDPDPRKLEFGTTYYLQLVARDADGEAPPSAEVAAYIIKLPGGSIEDNTVTASQVLAGSFTGEEFAGEVFIGSQFKTASVGQRLEFGVDGIKQYRSDNTRRFYVPPTDAEDVYIDAQVRARGLQVTGGSSFESTENAIEKDAVMRLAAGVSSPSTPLSATVYYDRVRPDSTPQTGSLGTFAFNATEVRSIVWNPAGLFNMYQNRTDGTRIWRFNPDGTYNSHVDFPDWDICNETWLPGDPTGWIMFRFIPAGQQYYVNHSGVNNTYSRTNSSRIPWIGHNATQIFVGEISTGALPRSAILGFRAGGLNPVSGSALPAPSSTITTNTSRSWDGVNSQVIFGSFPGASGTSRYAISEVGGTSTLRMFDTSGNWTDDDFDAPPTNKRGFLHDGTNFWTLGEDGWLYKHTNVTWPAATSSTWWSQATLRDDNATGGVHETKPGPVTPVAFTMKRRATYRVTFPPVPYAGGVDDPNKWVLYTGRGASVPANAAMFEQGTASNAALVLDVASLTTSGTNPPTNNNFPGATPGEIRSDDLLLRIKGDASIQADKISATNIRVGTSYGSADPVAIDGPYWNGWVSGAALAAHDTLTTLVTFTAEGSPNSSGITVATGIFTVPRAGRYNFRAQLYWALEATPVATRLLQVVSVSPSLTISSHTTEASSLGEVVNVIDKDYRATAGQQFFFRWRHRQGAGQTRAPQVASLDLSWVQIKYIGA